MRMVGDSSSNIIAAMVSGFDYSSHLMCLPASSSSALLSNMSMPSPSELLSVAISPPQPHHMPSTVMSVAPLPTPPPSSDFSPQKSAGQWGVQETRDFIAARAHLEKEFRQRKRNKLLWDAIAAKMRDLGYRRTAEQCKCKWKNLVNRYKGKETSEVADDGRQFAFFDDMQAIFVERAKSSNKHLLESDQPQHTAMPMPRRKRKKPRKGGERSSEELISLEEEEDDEDDEEEEDVDEEEEAESVEEERAMAISKKRKQKAERVRQRATAERSRAKSMKEVLEEFLEQQQRLEMEWKEGAERRERERRAREQRWREEMEAMENGRFLREQAWREREEQRRAREEERAMQRDALFSALLSRLARDDV